MYEAAWHRSRRGFTLLELLVVIAIIGILMGMLSGAVSMARRRAVTAACAQGLRQSGLAVLQLFLDNDTVNFVEGSGGRWVTSPCGCNYWIPGNGKVVLPVALDGCPMAPPNPLFEVDPANEPERQSYGMLDLARVHGDLQSSDWFLACSDMKLYSRPGDLAWARHGGRVNIFFFDGHVDTVRADQLDFPDLGAPP